MPTKLFLQWAVQDAEMRFLAAPRAQRWLLALKGIDARFARGDYADVLQALDARTREALALALIERLSPAPGGVAVPPRTGG